MPAKIIYKEGDSINGLVFSKEMPSEIMGGQLRRNAMFICFCGRLFKTRINDVKSNKVVSCGCVHPNHKHGNSVKGEVTPEYRAWMSMKARCYDPGARFYNRYGGRGIIVCDRWLGETGFENFLEDVGKRPSIYHSLDRHPNNNGNYEPGNTRWATQREQCSNLSRNRILQFNDESLTISEWSRRVRLSVGCIIWRLDKLNWPVYKTLSTPKEALKMDVNNVKLREKYLENKLS